MQVTMLNLQNFYNCFDYVDLKRSAYNVLICPLKIYTSNINPSDLLFFFYLPIQYKKLMKAIKTIDNILS